jgi:hypothetical protein
VFEPFVIKMLLHPSMVAKKVVRDWTNRNHIKQWVTTSGLKQAKGLSARRTKDLLKLTRDQLRWIVGLLTDSHLKEHFFKLGLADDPICERLPRGRGISHIHPM